MPSATETTFPDTAREPIAPWWHTVLVLAPLAVMSVASWYQHGLANAHIPGLGSRLSGYVTVLLAEWFQVLLIWLALRRRGLSIGSLVSGRWQTLDSFFRDLGVSIGFLVVATPLVGLLVHLLGASANIAQADITPKTVFELVVWLVLATTAGGFCEELIFRGYLMQQFSAWTGSRILAIFLQGVVFGLGHGFYGKAMVAVMVHGCFLGLLAYWRKSLLPGMLAHGLQDVAGGVAAFFS
jgi:membrane protease YdiL (CAAX protease family)